MCRVARRHLQVVRTGSRGKPSPAHAGVTADQQFFIAFAQSWAIKMREPAERQRLLVDVHAPPQFRALEVRNVDAWYTAFNVQPEQKEYLAPAARVHVW